MASQLILRMQQNSGDFSCEKFDNFPASKSAYVVISFTSTAESEQMAQELKNIFVESIKRLNSISSTPECDGIVRDFKGCKENSKQESNKLLIVVTDGQNDNFANPNIESWPFSILPVAKADSKIILKKNFGEKNAIFWKKSIAEIIPYLFGMIGISEIEQRIFISYRRDDSSEFAIQLFNRLHQEGFEVFLDRFSIEPSVNFQERLYQELADKAMVLFVESATYLESKWVQLEIDFAKTNRLGLYAININSSPKVMSLDDDYRFNVNLNTLKELDCINLDKLVISIKEQHAMATYRMREYLISNINSALRSKGISSNADKTGLILVKDKTMVKEFSILATTRPPLVNHFHYLDTSNIGGCDMIIVGPKFIEQKRIAINDWICKKASISYFNEGQLLELCDKINL